MGERGSPWREQEQTEKYELRPPYQTSAQIDGQIERIIVPARFKFPGIVSSITTS
jgi:hypothetical protein